MNIFEDRGFLCECRCGQSGEDLHHALLGRRVNFPELDCAENLIIVNHAEHINKKFDNRKWRSKFWKIQVKRYGYKHMIQWVENLPAKIRPKMNWVLPRKG